MFGALRRTLTAWTVATVGLAAPLRAQAVAALDAGAAWVEYDGFLPSGALSVSPTMSFRSPQLSLSLFGSYLRYESGNQSVQGEAASTFRSPPLGRWRPEVTLGGGLSTYRDFPSFGHGRIQTTLTYQRPGWIGWLEAIGGLTTHEGRTRPAWSSGIGVRRHVGTLTVGLDGSAGSVGDTSYADLIAGARWIRGPVEAAAFLGGRGLSTGAGRGLYAEATVLVALWRGLTAYAGGGRYPSDPLRGSLAGRYVSAGLRLSAGGPPRHRPPTLQLATMGTQPGTAGRLPGPAVAIVAGAGGQHLLRVVAADAQQIEVMGSFTGWEPLALARVGPATWQASLPLRPGLHRLNLRVDGGPWIVPYGAMELDDGFGGLVGQIVVR